MDDIQQDDYGLAVAAILRKKFDASGLSYTVISERTGLSRSTIVRVINGERVATVSYLKKLGEVFGVPSSSLLPSTNSIEEMGRAVNSSQRLLITPEGSSGGNADSKPLDEKNLSGESLRVLEEKVESLSRALQSIQKTLDHERKVPLKKVNVPNSEGVSDDVKDEVTAKSEPAGQRTEVHMDFGPMIDYYHDRARAFRRLERTLGLAVENRWSLVWDGKVEGREDPDISILSEAVNDHFHRLEKDLKSVGRVLAKADAGKKPSLQVKHNDALLESMSVLRGSEHDEQFESIEAKINELERLIRLAANTKND
jgi:transcriptional regulator with XRE-family HTH domain